MRFRIASKLNKEDVVVQFSALVYAMVEEAETVIGSFNLGADHSKDFDVVVQAE